MGQVTTSAQTEPKSKERIDLYQKVTDTIIQQLESGTVPWQKPWTGDDQGFLQIPKNCTTNKHYRGINIVLLWGASLQSGFQSNEWATFQQWANQKESIRKGEKGNMIVYYDTFEKEVEGEIKKIPFLKYSTVFNRCQLASFIPEAIPASIVAEQPLFERLNKVDAFVANTKVLVEHGSIGACYIPSQDKISMPFPQVFIDTDHCTAREGYYSTLLHELVHFTGHEKRMNRKGGKRFGDQAYAVEELVAELGAAFLCAEQEITQPAQKDHAAYIDHWLKVLKQDKHYIIAAASEASKAVEFLQNMQPK
jgi:antirestriction protein ArdC